MGCSYRIVDAGSGRDEEFRGEISVSYRSSLTFTEWLDTQFGFRPNEKSTSGRVLPLDENWEEQEYTVEFVREIAQQFPDPEATPTPNIMRIFLEAASRGKAVHWYA